ncbi:MAG: hypothetical protein UZ04_CHB001000770 [Chlorobi bacterium OLB4]|jgi:hypothetical protein|nr:MAG: hypothetical protein UZ04_CHB001000770 [Chlorobi bacterium OLB4]MBW7855584.1 hypothetical protein [Ignavibacteria bacterium]OQY79066.1 MAG: hypothetical protein B6D43_00270 [Ignavibacteriales bacterium UTCHB1]
MRLNFIHRKTFYRWKYILFVFIFSACSSRLPGNEYRLTDECVVVLADVEKGIELVSVSDDYTDKFGEFDLRSKLLVEPDAETPSVDDYLNNVASQVREWTDSEKEKIKAAVEFAASQFKKLSISLTLPDTIFVVKTTGREEGNAMGYTRSNYIVLTESGLFTFQQSLISLFNHELFHIISRSDENLREKIYSLIGFTKCNNQVLPEDLKNIKISNPDAPYFDYYAELETIDGTKLNGIMLMYSERPFDGGSFFTYTKLGFIAVTGEGMEKAIVQNSGKSVLIPLDQVKNFYDLIGNNTHYIINPEEIMAENFNLLLTEKTNLPNPEITDELLKILQTNKQK